MVSHAPYADLEIRILERQAQLYPVEITLNHEQEFPRGFLDPKDLPLPWVGTASAEADGERLFRWLLTDDRLKTTWAEVSGRCPHRRVRLRIDATAPELHALPWELLRDPGEGGMPQDLAATIATPFSRYLAGKWQPGSPVLKRPIKVLLAVASPQNLESEYQLPSINVEHEFSNLKEALKGLDVEITLFPQLPIACSLPTRDGEVVSVASKQQPCTLVDLELKLKQGYHILHFIGHGNFIKEEQKSVLYMADSENRVKLAYDADVAAMLARQLADPEIFQHDKLRLVFLSSCRTATRSPADAFRGMAPQLVMAGVPAVVAMQDLIPVNTAQAFARTFYRQLLEHGQVDLAANEARSSILTGKLPGASIPALFMRLCSGQLLGVRGQIIGDRANSFWNTLLENIADKECTPFLGSGMTTGLLPTPADLAQKLAAEYNYPFPTTQSLPRVAQFACTMDNRQPRKKVIRELINGFKIRMGLKTESNNQECSLCKIMEASSWSNCSQEFIENEIHHQLADLQLPLYITTNFDDFMPLALRAKRKDLMVRKETIKWREKTSPDPNGRKYDIVPPPSPEEPVVLHLFGSDDDLLSMVLTEDDYLDYLARISRDYEYLLPPSVQERLASTTLLFLGYRLEDLDLKVIMRGLLSNLNLEKWGMLHVAVQLESTIFDNAKQDEVIKYFQKYFSISRIDVYWGSTQQFIAELHEKWLEYKYA
jgi:hypothetical protein